MATANRRGMFPLFIELDEQLEEWLEIDRKKHRMNRSQYIRYLIEEAHNGAIKNE